MAATAAATDSTQLTFTFINSDRKTRTTSVPYIEIHKDPIEKRDALNSAGLLPVPFDINTENRFNITRNLGAVGDNDL